MVKSAKEAKEAIDACLYPPYGTRGFGPMGAIKWGIESEPEFIRNNLQGAVRMIQIEHIDAVRDIDEILKIPYLDGVVFGPNDLASSMGHICDMYNDDVQEVIKETIKKIKKKKKTIGVSLVTNDMKKIEYWKKLGVTFFSIGSDASFILNSAKELYKNLEAVIQK